MDPRFALQEIFGFEEFRPGQADAVDAALSDRDALVVMPTGSGKSVCYQLPALMREDLTLVVSPLVSLMQDQVSALERVAPGRVAVVNAQRGFSSNSDALDRVRDGSVRLLYVAPERFGSPRFAQAIVGARVGLFVVDEAHCVSQWGHDFRPDYFTLADAAETVGARATIALTATATPRVADDIVRRLRLREPVRVTTGFDRPNLSFAVIRCGGAHHKQRLLAAALSEPDALPAIVYAGTRGASEKLAGTLGRSLGEPVVAYHAGMDRGTRAAIQERFMSGQAPVIVATNAFGMGIDKSNVRTVCHASVPARSRPTIRRPAARAVTAAPLAACCSPSSATRDCTCSSSSARGSRSRRSSASASVSTGPGSMGATTSRCPSCTGLVSDRRDRTSASERSSATSPGPGCWLQRPRRRTAQLARSRAGMTAARRRSALGRRATPSACGGRSTGPIWEYVEGTRVPPCGVARVLRRPPVVAGAEAACCDVCDPIWCRRGRRVGAGAGAGRRGSGHGDRRRGLARPATGGPHADGRDPPGRPVEGRRAERL